MIRSILHPTDFSPVAVRALRFAAALAGRHGATLRVLHAVVFHDYEAHVVVNHELSARMNQLLSDLPDAPHVPAETLLRGGRSVAEVVLQEARTRGDSLIVMGTHGRGSLGQLFLGSVADKVMRYASVPVITAGRGEPVAGPLRNVLLGLDYSPASLEAAKWALHLARADGATLHLLHVVEELPPPGSAWELRAREHAEGAMNESLRTHDTTGVELRRHVLAGSVWRCVLQVAESERADLVLLGTQGRSGLARSVLGGTTEKVIRESRAPVLTVHVES